MKRLVIGGAVAMAGALAICCAAQKGAEERPGVVAKGGATEGTAPPPVSAVPRDLARGVKLELVTDAADWPVALVAAPEPDGRLFVVEKKGAIRALQGGELGDPPLLDLRGQVALWDRPNSEQGLLGLAFHPEFADNGLFYINYTRKGDGRTQVMEYRVSPDDPQRALPEPERTLLTVDQPFGNHNAGDLTFGPDGLLYLGLGDGGSAGDPKGHGQNPDTLLGSLLRLDVSQERPSPELLAIGLRNPWRISFDADTGDLYIADVGQNLYEYVHVVRAERLAPGAPRLNFGWNVLEGFHCFESEDCKTRGKTTGMELPILEYDHDTGCSITGGYVYRGKALPALQGQYFYGDYCTGLLRSVEYDAESAVVRTSWDWKAALDPQSRLAQISSFGVDRDGELYLLSHEGPIYKFVPDSP